MANAKLTKDAVLFLAHEAEKGGYIARVYGEAKFTQGDTLAELKHNIREAVLCHFDEGEAPCVVRLAGSSTCHCEEPSKTAT